VLDQQCRLDDVRGHLHNRLPEQNREPDSKHVTESLTELGPALPALVLLGLLVGLLYHLTQLLYINGFLEIGKGSKPHALFLILCRPMARENDYLCIRMDLLYPFQCLNPVHTRHLQVKHHDIRRILGNELDG